MILISPKSTQFVSKFTGISCQTSSHFLNAASNHKVQEKLSKQTIACRLRVVKTILLVLLYEFQ